MDRGNRGAKRAMIRLGLRLTGTPLVLGPPKHNRRVLQIFLVTVPFFALIAAGYAAARSGALPLAVIPGLNVFVLYFALPCMLFRFGAGAPIDQLLDGAVALVWGVSALIVVAATVALSRNER